MTAPIPDYSKVSLLLPMSGANAGTVFTGYSKTPKTMTVFGNAQTSTAQYKYYGSSGLFDGSGDYLTTPHAADLLLDGDFTIQLWYRMSAVATSGTFPRILSKGSDAAGGFIIYISSATIRPSFKANGATIAAAPSEASAPASVGDWIHFAVCRQGDTVTSFLNGIPGSPVTITGTVGGTNTLYIGYSTGTGAAYFNGNLQDVCIVRGAALYSGTFTPPTRLLGAISTDAANPILDDVGSPAIRSIVAFPRTYPQKVFTTTSASDGSFSLTDLPATEYTVVYLDDDAGTLHNDLVNRVIAA